MSNTCIVCTEPVAAHATICEQHEAMIEQGYICMVGVRDNFRSGSIVNLHEVVFMDVFKKSPPQEGYCFVDESVIDVIKGLLNEELGDGC